MQYQNTSQGAVPTRYTFFSTVAVDIWNASLLKGASTIGAVLVVSQASLESGFADSAIKYGDYNLFGTMTGGSDFKRKTKHGKVKDFSKTGGYKASMEYYFNHIVEHGWTGMDLIKKEYFAADDIDRAFNTGKYYPTKEERNKKGTYAYNSDMGSDGNNHYGDALYKQMKTTKKLFVAAMTYKIKLIANEMQSEKAKKDILGMTLMNLFTEQTKCVVIQQKIEALVL